MVKLGKKTGKNVDMTDNFDQLKKKYGEDSFNLVQDLENSSHVNIKTSIPSFNIITGGGIPTGRIIEIFGAESTGKTTLALQLISDFQKQDLTCAIVDLERCYYPDLGKSFGIDNSKLYISKPLYGEDAFQMIIDYVELLGVKLIVVDSVAALSSKDEVVENSNALGTQARMMSKWVRRIVPVLSKYNATVIFINQLRKQVGVVYANPETTTGGMALRFFSSLRIELKRLGYIKNKNDVIVGSEIRVKMHKNKMTNPFQSSCLKLYNGFGFSRVADLINLAEEADIVEKKGSWYHYKGNSLGQGLENVIENLEKDDKTFKIIEEEVNAYFANDKS